MARTIVTGATGFLGGKLARRLKAEGEDVIALGRNKQKGVYLENEGISFLAFDLKNKDALFNAFVDADYVFHCAAYSEDQGKYQYFYDANVLVTKNVLSAVKENRIKRLVYVSTPSLYVDTKDRFNLTEMSPFGKTNMSAYTKTKFVAEQLVDSANTQGVDVVTVRPRGIIGPGDDKLIPRLLRTNNKGIPVIDDGHSLIDLTHVDDVVDALLLARAHGFSGSHYNITGDNPLPFIDLMNYLCDGMSVPLRQRNISFTLAYSLATMTEYFGKLFNVPVPLTRYTTCLLGKTQTFAIDKAKNELAYVPKKSVVDAIEGWIDAQR